MVGRYKILITLGLKLFMESQTTKTQENCEELISIRCFQSQLEPES